MIWPSVSPNLRYFDQELVIFRTESGAVKVLDAYCPHMGAHLGYGSVIRRVEARVSSVSPLSAHFMAGATTVTASVPMCRMQKSAATGRQG